MPTTDSNFSTTVYESSLATKLMEPLMRFDTVSSAIMIGYVLSYADYRKPTIAALYRSYKTEVERKMLPSLSMYVFRSSIESLDPVFVLSNRYGKRAAASYLGGRRRSRSGTAAILPAPIAVRFKASPAQ